VAHTSGMRANTLRALPLRHMLGISHRATHTYLTAASLPYRKCCLAAGELPPAALCTPHTALRARDLIHAHARRTTFLHFAASLRRCKVRG